MGGRVGLAAAHGKPLIALQARAAGSPSRLFAGKGSGGGFVLAEPGRLLPPPKLPPG